MKYDQNSHRYVQFPLFLLRNLFADKVNTLHLILDYGIYRYAMNCEYQSLRKVAIRAIHSFYAKNSGEELRKEMNRIYSNNIGTVEGCKNFKPEVIAAQETEVNYLLECFAANENLTKYSIENYRMYMALSSLNLKGDMYYTLNRARQVVAQIPENEPMPMVNVDLLLEMRDNDKSEFEIAQFLAFTAIKSILGQKHCVKTNKKHILSRMFGYTSIKKAPQPGCNLFNKYSNRYHIDRVLKHLEMNWNVKLYSNHIRGFYVSIGNKMSRQELAAKAEKSKIKNKIMMLKEAKKAAQTKALNALRNADNRYMAG